MKTFAKDQIASLIQKHGRDVYAKVEEQAASELAERLKATDQKGVEDILRKYPNALIASETKHQLARLKKNQGDPWSAIRIWREVLKEPASTPTRQAVLWELALTLEEKNYLRPAREAWRMLSREFPSARLPTENGPKSATDFITQHLQTEEYRWLDSSAPRLPLSRQWERKLEPGARPILPEGHPPGPRLGCVLLDDRGLVCVDASQGQTRWQKSLNDPVIWAAYGPVQLVIGTDHSLLAVTLETGQTLWQTPLDDPDEDTPAPPRFQMAGERILVLEQHQVSSYNIHTGEPVWQRLAAGRFSDLWHADPELIVVQNENPLRVWVYETLSGRKLSEHQPPEAWSSPPARFQSPPPGSANGPLPKQSRLHRGPRKPADPGLRGL